MLLAVSGKHIDVKDSLRAHVDERLSSAVGKYFDRAIDSVAQFTKGRHLYRSDISVQAHGETDDIQAAFNTAASCVEMCLRRYHRRLTDHHADKFNIETAIPATQTVLAAEHMENS